MGNAVVGQKSVGVADAPKPTGHSRFGASKAERWVNCTASVKAEEGREDTPSIYAQEGTAQHTVSAMCLESGQDAIEFVDRTVDGIEITEDHAEAIQLYLDTIRADKEERGGKLFVERRFHLEWLHPEFFGTSDCGRTGRDRVLCVYDAKFGRGVVEVAYPDGNGGFRPNKQLAYYALGMIETLPPGVKVDKIELVIIQPYASHRDGPVRRHVFEHSDLLDVSADLVAAAEEADGPNAKFVPGDHCTFCKAAGVCKALRNFVMDTAQLDFDDEKGIVKTYGDKTVNPLDMTPAQVENAMDAADLIEAWVNAVRYHGVVLANGGTEFERWKLVQRKTHRRWKSPETVANDLSLVFGLDDSSIFKQKVVSPAQVEKLIPKEERHALADLYEKPVGANTLARVTDGRQEEKSTAQSDFDD